MQFLRNILKYFSLNHNNGIDKQESSKAYSFSKDMFHSIHEIEDQYRKRIENLQRTNLNAIQKTAEREKLEHNLCFDPRRSDIFHKDENTALKNKRIASRLHTIASKGQDSFNSHPYVLTWSDIDVHTWVSYVSGDITELTVDAVVNPANSLLMGGGGVDGAIHEIAGHELLSECSLIIKNKYPSGLSTGQVVLTKGYNSKAKYIIHTVGPVWEGGSNKEEELLYDCYFNSLLLAKDNKINTIAFPEISTGAYKFPKEKAKPIVVSAIRDFVTKYPGVIEEIILVSYK